jgi:hypothetical protein
VPAHRRPLALGDDVEDLEAEVGERREEVGEPGAVAVRRGQLDQTVDLTGSPGS